MATSRVGEVQLRLRLPAELAGSAERIRATVERELLVRILDELERIMHARFGAASVIRIRRVAVSWQLDELELASTDVCMRLAQDLAEQLVLEVATQTAAQQLRPRGESIAVFASERHADAAYLADVVDRSAELWIHTRRDAEEVWRDVVASGPHAVGELMGYLARMNRLEPAIALAPDAVIDQLAAATPAEYLAAIAVPVARASARREAARAAMHDEQRRRQDSPVPQLEAATASDAGGAARSPAAVPSVPVQSEVVDDSRALSARAAPKPSGLSEPAARVAGDTHPRGDESAGAPGGLSAEILGKPDGHTVETSFAGVFYLAGRVLEIELAERLWAVGLPEGDVLAHIAAAIVGGTDDPAWAWFGGSFDRTPTEPAVPGWAATEVIETVQHALGRRLVRFGISLSPTVLDAQLDELATSFAPPVTLAPPLHRIVTRGAAALCVMVAARLERAPSLELVRTVCRRSGRLVLSDDALHVVMSDGCVDIDHRRAGLDHDPGNVPWLQRRVHIEFVGATVL